MKTSTLIEAAAMVLGTALVGPAATERPKPSQAPQELAPAAAAPASDVAAHRLSARERAELRRQLAEYSRAASRTVLTNCKPSDTCPSSD